MPYLNNSGIGIYYRTEGAGSPVVLMHGTSGDMETWRDYGYVDALNQSHRLILIDSRGHGHSDKPHDPATYTLVQRVGDIVAVLDALEIRKAHYVGYSMGGWIGFGMAKHAPDRVLSLSLGGAHPYEDSMKMQRDTWAGRTTADVLAQAEADGRAFTEDRRVRYLANDPQALAALCGPRENNEAVLSGMKMPCLIYCGDADPRHPLAKKAAAAVTGAKFASLPGLDHPAGFSESRLALPHLRAFLNPSPLRGDQQPAKPL
ncbi:MAG: alpha/beta fold hydrolase [Dehalococcoidia bacterium]|nr:alpha/beta fold hydrolase [Dehalococcoidia bacterium]MSQ35161.1 alpha/beta fold hydrolase [Dehalococcoidia bacterium]